MILYIVERLRAQPASWAAVAAALFAVEFDLVRLLEAISLPRRKAGFGRWKDRARRRLALRRVSPAAESVIRQALKTVGFRDIRVLWLATLAVLLDSTCRVGGRNGGLEGARSSSAIDFGPVNALRGSETSRRRGT